MKWGAQQLHPQTLTKFYGEDLAHQGHHQGARTIFVAELSIGADGADLREVRERRPILPDTGARRRWAHGPSASLHHCCGLVCWPGRLGAAAASHFFFT